MITFIDIIMETKTRYSVLMFLFGLGSCLNFFLIGALSFTELACFMIAPLLLLKNARIIQREKVMPAVYLPFLLILGNVIVYLHGGESTLQLVKNSALYYSIFAQVVVLYFLLRNSINSLSWYFVGLLISTYITMFVFNTHIVSAEGEQIVTYNELSIEEQMDGILFWVLKINGILTLPVKSFYFQMPLAYSSVIGFVCMMISLLISSSGRSAGAGMAVGSILVLLCGKSRQKMARIGRHFVWFALIGIVSLVVLKNIYVYTAANGYLGYEAQQKYLHQVRNTSLLGVLMGGRSEFFIAARAILDHPILGFVDGKEDKMGYRRDFLLKYGDNEDMIRHYNYTMWRLSHGEVEEIPIHSALMQFWGNSGIVGLFFWCWFLYLIFCYYKKYSMAIPQWWGPMAFSIPLSIFTVFFNPYHRGQFPLIIACILICRATSLGFVRLPPKMELEARRYE